VTRALDGARPITISSIVDSLRGRSPTVHRVPIERHASVAMILEPGEREHSVLFIERARKKTDPWSGQIAFPGGRREPVDVDECAVAVRETREEIGIALEESQYVGRLDDLKGRHGGTSEGMVISCFVYALEAIAEVSPNYEVAAVARLPLSHLVEPGNIVMVDRYEGREVRFPGIRFGGRDTRVVWGLTYRFLRQFLGMLGHRLPEGG
jgi:8-oxo-dGTP pyrophosphatase MutT (NUDIX family)